MLVDGRAPAFLAPYLAGAKLAALDKTKRGVFDVRPIAAGQIVRHIAAKCLCALVTGKAAAFFRGDKPNSGQFGVACPGGAERVIHRVRHEVDVRTGRVRVASPSASAGTGGERVRDEHEHKECRPEHEFVVFKVDFKNAFNLASRALILALVTEHFPEIALWAYWCYGQPGGEDPLLWFAEWVMSSKEGVQQGDPLGPLLFSLVIQKLIAAINAMCPGLALNLWYLDDGVLAGRTADVAAALAVIAELGPDLGLELNLVKNEAVFFWDDTPDPFPKEVERFRDGFELLGSPIGDEAFCHKFISKFTAKAVAHTLGPLSSLDDPQIVHMLIRLCASYCRVVHLLRAVPPAFAHAAIAEFDGAVQKAFAHGVGVLFTESALLQLRLPLTLGGAGMRRAADHSAGAYLSSVMRAGQTDRWPAYAAAGFSPAVDELCARSGLCAAAVCDPATPHTQRFFSEAVDKHCFAALLAAAPQRDKARLLSVSGEGAGAWLGVIPSESLGYVLSPREFSVLLKWWFGMNVFDSVFACPGCGAAMDRAGYHALTCRHLGSFGVRHNALREVFLQFLSQAGIKDAVREAPSLLPGTAARPADIFVPNYAGTKAACLDFAVTHTQQPNTIERASVCAGAAAEQYELKVKEETFGASCRAAGLLLVPMVVEVFGTWGARSAEAMQLVTKACASRASEKCVAAAAHLRRSLAVTLQRLNARILLAHLDPEAEVFGEPLPLPADNGMCPFLDHVAEALDDLPALE